MHVQVYFLFLHRSMHVSSPTLNLCVIEIHTERKNNKKILLSKRVKTVDIIDVKFLNPFALFFMKLTFTNLNFVSVLIKCCFPSNLSYSLCILLGREAEAS